MFTYDKNSRGKFQERLLGYWAIIITIFYLSITIYGWVFSYVIYKDLNVFPFHYFDINDFLLAGLKILWTILAGILLGIAICARLIFWDIINIVDEKVKPYFAF